MKRATSRKTLKESKREHWIKFLENLKNNTRTADIWKQIKLIDGKKICTLIPAVQKATNTITTNYRNQHLRSLYKSTSHCRRNLEKAYNMIVKKRIINMLLQEGI